jgi:hypothetical protein
MRSYGRPLLLALLLAISAVAFAQEYSPSVPYQGQNTGGYQMFYGPHARADTYLVNTATGAVWLEVETKQKKNAFQKISVVPRPSVMNPKVGRFRIYFSPHARMDSYLCDTLTGQLWIAAQDPTTSEQFFSAVRVEGIQ